MCYIMSKLKILVLLDGTEKSMHSLDWLKKFFSKEDTEITLINVIQAVYNREIIREMASGIKLENVEKESIQVLDKAAIELKGYKVNKLIAMGYSSDEILKEAKDGNYDMIVMTKSSIKGISRVIGSVTNKVIHHSDVTVVIVPE
jgi:nucleotide-binding universal stress UspA family protein